MNFEDQMNETVHVQQPHALKCVYTQEKIRRKRCNLIIVKYLDFFVRNIPFVIIPSQKQVKIDCRDEPLLQIHCFYFSSKCPLNH